MLKVYCVHHWIAFKKTKTRVCTICGEFWNPAKEKDPPTVPIGMLANYAPVFATRTDPDSEFLVKDTDKSEEKRSPVYCNHVWDNFGPKAKRCLRCRNIWKQFETSTAPKVIIGYSEPQN